jgi:mRNA-degrading endonuclease RelE of RelBE toxin-antitoxin system
MKTKILITINFAKEAKKLIKKFNSLKFELEQLELELQSNPTMGVPLGNNSYKIRLAVKSKGKGKSGGVRIITHIEVILLNSERNNNLYLLSIYDKSNVSSIRDKDILNIISQIKN